MISILVDFETIQQGKEIFKCTSELHLDASYENIIHSTIWKHLIECKPGSEEKKRLVRVIKTKLSTELSLATIWQDPSLVDFKLAESLLLSRANKLPQQLPEIDHLIGMAIEVRHK